MARITNEFIDARVARLNALMGTDYVVERGSAYTAWKLTNSAGSQIIGWSPTRAEFDHYISGAIMAAEYFNPGAK